MKNKYYPGSYTVEASLLMGIILAVIFSVLYISFISYDRLRLSFLLRETALWGAAKIEQGEKVTQEQLIAKAGEQQILLLNMKEVSFHGEIKNNEILISYTAKEFFLGGHEKTRSFEATKSIHRPETALRIAHLFYKGGEQ